MSSRKRTPGSHSDVLLGLGLNVSLSLGDSNPSSGSSDSNHDGLLGSLLGSLWTTSGGSAMDVDALVTELLNSLNISVPIPGGNQSSGLEVNLDVCFGADVSGTQDLLDTITNVVNSLFSSLLGTTLSCKVESSCPTTVDPDTTTIDIQACGLSDDSLVSTLNKTLKTVTDSLNLRLDGANIFINSNVLLPPCPAATTPSNSSQPLPSPPGVDLNGLLDDLLGQVEGILGSLGLGSGDYSLDTDTNLVAGVSVGLSDTLASIDGLVDAVIALVDEILDSLLGTNITVLPNQNPTPSSAPSNSGQGDGIVIDIDLGVVLDATLSGVGDLVDGVLSAVAGVLAGLPNVDVIVNVDGGPECGCGGSKKASAKK